MHPGQQSSEARSRLKIKFVSVLEDSRCPVNVKCVTAGNAKIQVRVSDRSAHSQTFVFNSTLGPKGDQFQGYDISLVSLKARLTGQAGEELILFLLDAQPPCTEEQQAQIDAGNFENGGGTAIYCAASGETLAKVIPPMQNRLSKVAAQIPDEAILIKPASEVTSDENPFTAIRMLYSWMRLSLLLPLSLLVLVTLFGVRSIKSGLRWWGIPLFIAGLIALGIGIAAQPILDWAWVNYAIPQMPPIFSSGLGELGHDLFSSVAGELGKQLMLEAGPILLLGLAAIIGSFYVKPATPSDLGSPPPNSK